MCAHKIAAMLSQGERNFILRGSQKIPPKKRKPLPPKSDVPTPDDFEAVWAIGLDLTRSLEPFGITDNPSDLESRARIERAWHSWGQDWIQTFVPEPGNPAEPYALTHFGPPRGGPPCQ